MATGVDRITCNNQRVRKWAHTSASSRGSNNGRKPFWGQKGTRMEPVGSQCNQLIGVDWEVKAIKTTFWSIRWQLLNGSSRMCWARVQIQALWAHLEQEAQPWVEWALSWNWVTIVRWMSFRRTRNKLTIELNTKTQFRIQNRSHLELMKFKILLTKDSQINLKILRGILAKNNQNMNKKRKKTIKLHKTQYK